MADAETNESAEPERRPYVRQEPAAEPLEFWVDTPDGSVLTRARRLGVYEWRALDDHLIGEIREGADPEGTERRRQDVIRLKHVVLEAEHPEWQGDAEKFYRMAGNDLLAAMTWDKFCQETMGALASPRTKSGPEAHGRAGGAGELAAGADGEAHA